ncbi:MAG: hypothetical protein NTW14_09350 [bacterium]|nr:hypothetical protein [bacterium]
MKTAKQILREEGSFPILAIIMIGMLIFTGLAFLKWGADESWQTKFARHQMQAFYAAHAGMMHKGFTYLNALTPSTIPPQGISLGGETVTDFRGKAIATVEGVFINPSANQSGSAFSDQNYLDVTSYGRVQFKDYEGKTATVRDSLTLKIRVLGLSNFLYLTNIETTTYGEAIKFWHEDTLDGWVHSNDTIAIMENPVFYNQVTTTAPVFWHGTNYNPQFSFPPKMNYREIYLPTEATDIRAAAQSAGLFFESPNDMYDTRLVFYNNQGWKLWQWQAGTPFDSTASPDASGPPPTWQAIFVDGYLELAGTVRGQVTVGAHGMHATGPQTLGKHCIYLLDDIKYWFAGPGGHFNDSTAGYTDILGIVSESNITIANTWANGKNNSELGADIIITAAMVALGESFSFDWQNEPAGAIPWEFWNNQNSESNPDERGDILLHGAVTQYRRGYVHRSNQGGTGYGKSYHFDRRLNLMSPPYYLEATDSQGHAHFEIVSWGNR